MRSFLKTKYVFVLLAVSLPGISPAAAQSGSVSAARAECFRQANEAANAVNFANPSATAERNARGVQAYRDCARRMGIRP